MPGTHLQDDARIQAFVPSQSRKRYVVARREDVWFIVFNGEDFGPYKNEREAKLFAIDAAFKLGEKGEEFGGAGGRRGRDARSGLDLRPASLPAARVAGSLSSQRRAYEPR